MSDSNNERLTGRQHEVLQFLQDRGNETNILTIEKSQEDLADEFGMTAQGLSNHLRKLKENEFIRTGRKFIDITEKGLKALNKKDGKAVICVKSEPNKRSNVYEKVSTLSVKSKRVTGDIDLIIETGREDMESLLTKLSKMDGVKETKTHIVLKKI